MTSFLICVFLFKINCISLHSIIIVLCLVFRALTYFLHWYFRQGPAHASMSTFQILKFAMCAVTLKWNGIWWHRRRSNGRFVCFLINIDTLSVCLFAYFLINIDRHIACLVVGLFLDKRANIVCFRTSYCPTHTLERIRLWPPGADLRDKLWGSLEELQTIVQLVHQEHASTIGSRDIL